MPKKKKRTKQESLTTHEELKGFDIKINEFGEVVSSLKVDKLNRFLNDKMDDKKLRGNTEEE